MYIFTILVNLNILNAFVLKELGIWWSADESVSIGWQVYDQ